MTPGGRGALAAIELDDGRRIEARPTTDADAGAVYGLYERLPSNDRGRRFFSTRLPSLERVASWTSPDRPGAAIVAEVVDGDERTVIGEAGYSLTDDGDGELAITVDPDWRGGVGTWLLGVLVAVAAEHGVPNLHADVMLLNRPMLGLLRRRPHATVEHPDVGQVRLVIGTDGRTPSWPAGGTRPRLLVEGVKGFWWGERLAHDAGFDLRVCAGPAERDDCPVLCGEECPLVAGADVVLSGFPADHPHAGELRDRLRSSHPGLTVVVPGAEFDVAESATRVIDELRQAAAVHDASPPANA